MRHTRQPARLSAELLSAAHVDEDPLCARLERERGRCHEWLGLKDAALHAYENAFAAAERTRTVGEMARAALDLARLDATTNAPERAFATLVEAAARIVRLETRP